MKKVACLSCKRRPNIQYRIKQRCPLCEQVYGILCGTRCSHREMKYLNKHLEEQHASVNIA